MEVTIATSYTLAIEGCQAKWAVNDDCLKEVNGNTYFQVKCHKYGLVKLLAKQGQKLPKNPSIKNSPGIQNLMDQRNRLSSLCGQPSASSLFADEAGQADDKPVAKKQKVAKPEVDPTDPDIMLNLEDYGSITCRPATMKREDLLIPFSSEYLTMLFCICEREGHRHYCS